MQKKKGLHDEIARVAHELYEKRGRIRGHELEDWLDAEKIVMEKHERHASETEQWQEGDRSAKPQKGFRRTVKKEGFYKKG
ncbi:MAG: DUF2934 domain-containing protein [bacterium]